MPSFQVTVTILSKGLIALDHKFNIVAANLAAAETAAASFMTEYQAIISVQVVALKVNGTAVTFSQLRANPAGVEQCRLFLTFKTAVDSETDRRYKVQFALSDPIATVRDYLTTGIGSAPTEWSSFLSAAQALVCHFSGTLIETLTKVSFTENLRSADQGSYIGRYSATPQESAMKLHASNHLDNGIDPLIFTESEYVFVGEHRFGAVGYITLGIFDCAGLLASGTTGISRTISLRKWRSGDVTCRIWYVVNTTSGGNIKLQLRTSCRANNGAQAAEDTQTAIVVMGAASQLHFHDAFTVPAASIAKGDVMTYYLERLGNDGADTETQQYPICGIEWLFAADLPHV